MNPQLAAYLLILATFSPAVIVGWLVWWGTRGEEG